jgi:hypothetical protein
MKSIIYIAEIPKIINTNVDIFIIDDSANNLNIAPIFGWETKGTNLEMSV